MKEVKEFVGSLLLFPHANCLFFWAPSGMVIYYNYMVPEGERHDTAIKRNRETLSAEVKLWEGYLEQVRRMAMKNSTFAQTKEQ